MASFLAGTGDVLLSYESDGISTKREGKGDYVVPPRTILTQAPIAITKGSSPVATDFLHFIWSDHGQILLAKHGYRPLNTNLVIGLTFPTPVDLFAVSEFGGWEKVNPEFFNEETGSIAKIEKELGVPTSG
jgi:sulfate transport system substrate-binding protein